MRQRCPIAAILATLAACSSHGSAGGARHIATLKESGRCAAGNGYVYVLGGRGLYRVGEQGGDVAFLTNDLGIVGSVVVANGSVYWTDEEGVEVFAPGAAARKTLVGSKESPPTSLIRVGEKICWVKSIEPAKVQCMALADHSIVFTMNVSPGIDKLASNAKHLFALEKDFEHWTSDNHRTRLEEIPPVGDSPNVLTEIGFPAFELGALDDGPVLLSDHGLWRIDHGAARQLASMDSPRDLLTVSGHIFATTESAVVEVDPNSGAVTELAKTHERARSICTDGNTLYFEDRAELFQVGFGH
jgi:hypothetical protein